MTKQKRRVGFVQFPIEFSKKTYRILKWRKFKRGGSINEIFLQKAEQIADETIKQYGEPPEDFEVENK